MISITRLLFIRTLSFTFILCIFLVTFSKDNMETLALLKLMAKPSDITVNKISHAKSAVEKQGLFF